MNNTTIAIDGTEYSFHESKKQLFSSSGELIAADIVLISEGEYSVLINGRSVHVYVHNRGTVTVNNRLYEAVRETPKDKLAKQLQQETGTHTSAVTVRAPMPGLVAKLLRKESDAVSAGEGILVVEAMKMENEIKSPKTGIVKKITVREKQTVEKNDPLFTIE